MNLYDEALESIDKLEISKEYLFQPVLETIIKALERAKKVEELLVLINKKGDYLVHIMNGAKGLQENYMKLLAQINELEKELEEMK